MEIAQYQQRFGNVAMERGFITQDELMEAKSLQISYEITEKGHRHIGGILFDLDYLTPLQLDEVIKVVDQEIVKKHSGKYIKA